MKHRSGEGTSQFKSHAVSTSSEKNNNGIVKMHKIIYNFVQNVSSV